MPVRSSKKYKFYVYLDMFNKIIQPAILILAVSFASGFLFNLLSENSLPIIYKPVDLEPGMNLDGEQVYRVLREGRALFIDARYEKEYRAGHIPGAISVPANLPRDELTARLEPIARDTIIVVYCSNASYCGPNTRHITIEVNYDGQNVYRTETVYTQIH